MRPEILTAGGLPMFMFGLSPRVIMGNPLWNKERVKVYEKSNFHCVACGTHKSEVKGARKQIEAHELYKYDYDKAIVEIDEIVALCPYCHSFIHINRTLSVLGCQSEIFKNILQHGFDVLRNLNIDVDPDYINIAEKLKIDTSGINPKQIDNIQMKHTIEKWCLLYNGQEYRGEYLKNKCSQDIIKRTIFIEWKLK